MKNNEKSKVGLRLKIALSMVASFLVVGIGSPMVFLADTPHINPTLTSDLPSLPVLATAFLRNPLNSEKARWESERQAIRSFTPEPAVELIYQPIMKGVSAAEDVISGRRYAKVEAGTQVEVRYVKLADGRTVKVYVPISQ